MAKILLWRVAGCNRDQLLTREVSGLRGRNSPFGRTRENLVTRRASILVSYLPMPYRNIIKKKSPQVYALSKLLEKGRPPREGARCRFWCFHVWHCRAFFSFRAGPLCDTWCERSDPARRGFHFPHEAVSLSVRSGFSLFFLLSREKFTRRIEHDPDMHVCTFILLKEYLNCSL